MKITKFTLAAFASAAFLTSCNKDSDTTTTPTTDVVLKSHSVTPALVKKPAGFENLEIFSLIGSDDKLDQSPNYVFGGSADGAGLFKNTDGTFSYMVNHEDNFAVSRVTFDKTLKPVKGEYVLNSDGGLWRLCSATLATQAEHGFGPLFLTCGESGEESRTHGLELGATTASAPMSRELAALGRQSAENAMPLPKTAYPGKTAIIIGDDDNSTYGGQVLLYWANVGDLQNGELFVMRRKDLNQKERDMKVGEKYEVEFVKIENQKSLTGRQQNILMDQTLKAIKFGRVEDTDYRKDGVGREIYINVTGQANIGVNADNSRSKYGRVYKLNLATAAPTSGTLELVLDGDDRTGKAKMFQNVDNILVTKNYLYTQEDPNNDYNDQTHDAYVYQYNLATGELKIALELDHRRNMANEPYNAAPGTGYPKPVADKSGYGSWEYGAMLDVSDQLGIPDAFMICIQPHTWRGDKYKSVDGGKLRPDENQASQIVLVKGLPR